MSSRSVIKRGISNILTPLAQRGFFNSDSKTQHVASLIEPQTAAKMILLYEKCVPSSNRKVLTDNFALPAKISTELAVELLSQTEPHKLYYYFGVVMDRWSQETLLNWKELLESFWDLRDDLVNALLETENIAYKFYDFRIKVTNAAVKANEIMGKFPAGSEDRKKWENIRDGFIELVNHPKMGLSRFYGLSAWAYHEGVQGLNVPEHLEDEMDEWLASNHPDVLPLVLSYRKKFLCSFAGELAAEYFANNEVLTLIAAKEKV